MQTSFKTVASKEKQHNKFDVTSTPVYKHLKELDNEVSPVGFYKAIKFIKNN